MAITNTILLKGLLGAVVCLGSASAAIANKDKIVGYFSKDNKDKKGGGVNTAPDGTAVSGATTTTGTTEGDQTKDNKASEAGTGPQAAPGKDVGQTPSTGDPGTGGSPAAGTNGAAGGVQGGSGSSNPSGGAGGTPSQPAATNTGSTFTNEEINKINEKITTTLKLPDGCKFENNAKDHKKECSITKEQLQKVNFLGKAEEQGLTIAETFSNLKLEIKVLDQKNDEDKKKYGENKFTDKDLRFTFKDISQKIEVKKGGKVFVTLIKNTDPEFEIYNERLINSWYPSSLGFKVGLICDYDGSKACKPRGGDHSIKLFDNSSIKEIKIEDSYKSEEIKVEKDQEGYNQGYKFNVTKAITGKDSSGELKNGDYEIKYIDKKGWALVKKENS